MQRWLKFAKYLPQFDWEPVVVTVDPKKATYPVLDNSLQEEIGENLKVVKTDSSEWFSFYKNVSGSKKVPYAGFANEKNRTTLKQRVARFIRGNFFLPDPRRGWNIHALNAAREIIHSSKIDCIITTSPPHSTQLIGQALSKEFNIPWVADSRDPWTEIYYYKQFYPTIFAHRNNLRMERSILKHADSIITVGPSLKKLFAGKIEGDDSKITVLTNGYDEDDFLELPEQGKDRFIVTYVGTMSDIYPIDVFLEGFKGFLKKSPGALFRCIGTISPGQRQKIMTLPEENYELIPYVKHRMAIEFMSSSDALLLIIPSSANNQMIVTGKIFEYLAVGRPILFLGPLDSDGAHIIESGGSGATISYKDNEKIFEKLIEWEKNAPKIQSNPDYERKAITQKLAGLLNDLSK